MTAARILMISVVTFFIALGAMFVFGAIVLIFVKDPFGTHRYDWILNDTVYVLGCAEGASAIAALVSGAVVLGNAIFRKNL